MISRTEEEVATATSSNLPPIMQSISKKFDESTFKKSCDILSVIHRYRTSVPDGVEDRTDEGDLKFLSIIYSQVKANIPIQLVLPAFPFKSPNRIHKTLGNLPDKGDHMSLAHLNSLCAAITDIYDIGAKLTIASDGIVYNGKIFIQLQPF